MADINITGLPLAADFAADDVVEIAGATNGNRRLDLRARIQRGDVLRAMMQGIFFDGITSGMRHFVPLGSAGNVASSPLTVSLIVAIPAANPAALQGVFYIGSASDGYGSSAYTLAGVIDTFGRLVVGVRGGAANSFSARVLRFDGVVTNHGGNDLLLTVTWDRTGAPTVYFNALAQLASAEETQGPGPYPAWTEAISTGFLVLGILASADRFSGAIYRPLLLNRVWSAAEVRRYAQSGQLPISDEIGTGSMLGFTAANGTRGNTLTNASFEADLSSPPNGWTNNGNHTGTATADGTAPDGARVCVIVASGAGSTANCVSHPNPSLVIGRRYRLQFRAKSDAGNATLTYNIGGGSGFAEAVANLGGDWQAFGTEAVVIATPGLLRFWLGGAGTCRIDKIELIDLGPVFDLEPDPNLGWRDRKANGLHATRTAGTEYVGGKTDSMPAFKVSHVGPGVTNLQFNGGAALDASKGWALDTLVVRSTAAGTWSFGNVSAGKQYVADFSLAGGDNYIMSASLVTRLISGANLWSQFSTAGEISIFPVLRRTF